MSRPIPRTHPGHHPRISGSSSRSSRQVCPLSRSVSYRILTTHRVVEHVHDFLTLMRECHAVLVGQSALMFIIQCPAPSSHTFTVPHEHSHRFLHHLIARCAFRIRRDIHTGINDGDYCRESPRGRFPGIERVVHLLSTDNQARPRVPIIVAVTGTETHPGIASLPVTTMTSTLMFNYLAADGLVCAYPSLTLRRRTLFHLERVPPCVAGRTMTTYARSGIDYRIRPDNWDVGPDGRNRHCDRSWLSPCVQRSFGDRGCLIVSFDGRTVDGQGSGWVWGGMVGCTTHGRRMTQMHLPACTC